MGFALTDSALGSGESLWSLALGTGSERHQSGWRISNVEEIEQESNGITVWHQGSERARVDSQVFMCIAGTAGWYRAQCITGHRRPSLPSSGIKAEAIS